VPATRTFGTATQPRVNKRLQMWPGGQLERVEREVLPCDLGLELGVEEVDAAAGAHSCPASLLRAQV
jgi:hypothetical protein